MLLRWLLMLLVGWALFRAFRRVSAVLSRPPREAARPRSLDPERAVEASWEEVDEEGADR